MDYSFRITKEQYNYLLPVCRNKLLYAYNGISFKNGTKKDLYAFIGSREDFDDIVNRCKYLDEDLLKESLEYKERFDYNVKYNSGLSYKQIHH